MVNNSPINYWDHLGLWRGLRRRGQKKAPVCAQRGDSWESLGKIVGLNGASAKKWVTGFTPEPIPGKWYYVPNVVAMMIGEPDDEAEGKLFMKELEAYAIQYTAAGYFTEKVPNFAGIKNDNTLHAVVFNGHGGQLKDAAGKVTGSFVVKKGKKTVLTGSWTPKYGLGFVVMAACYSADGQWESWVSLNGEALLFEGCHYGPSGGANKVLVTRKGTNPN